MIDPADVPSVGVTEILARYIMHSSHVRADQTVKPDAFMPYSLVQMSVTRHLRATENEIWTIGHEVAALRQRSLHGRADIATSDCLRQRLAVTAAPIEGNPNHANVGDWPVDKPAQKIIALELASKATLFHES